MDLTQFNSAFPQYSIDFNRPLKEQGRIHSPEILATLPNEIAATFEYRSGSRGRPNLNQTLTHSQCATCKRVLRNDNFYSPPSLMRRNVVHTHCLSCTKKHNAERHEKNSGASHARSLAIWEYIAPQCAHCGFDEHGSAMDMHHPGKKDALVAVLIADLSAKVTSYNAEKLLHEAKNCTPLCSNCHRMLHAGVIQLSASAKAPRYNLVDLMNMLGNIKG